MADIDTAAVIDTDDEVLVIGGKRYLRRDRYARERKVAPRTIARRCKKGMPFLDWAGSIWIQPEEGDAFIAASVKRRNPPRRSRRQAAFSS